MKESKRLKMISKAYTNNYIEFENCINDFLRDGNVYSMDKFIQHSDVTCLEHCFNVAYNSFLICRFFGLDYKSAARGALLHDFFLYDWHVTKPEKGLHAFSHPYIALKNADKIFDLNEMEKDIIVKHMWPLTVVLPRYRESLIVSFSDKFCALMETVAYRRKSRLAHQHILLKYRLDII